VGTGVSEEDADLAVIDFAEATTPLTGHAARLGAFLGEAGGVEDEGGLGVADLFANVAAEFGGDGRIVPLGGADEELEGTAGEAGVDGNGLSGFTLEGGEFAAKEDEGVVAVFTARKEREVALGKGVEVRGAGANVVRGEFGILEQALRFGVIEKIHGSSPAEKKSCCQGSRPGNGWLD
jgi:hypothetical protein